MMDSTNRIALLQQAESADTEGNHDEALGILSRCLDLYPGFSPARVLRGEILSRIGRTDDAVGELDAIIRSNPENIRARILLTRTYAEAGRSGEALTHLEFLGFMMPENDPALVELRDLLDQGAERAPTLQVDDPTLIEEPAPVQSTEDASSDFSDTVTEVFVEADLAVSEEEADDATVIDEIDQEMEPIEDEVISPADIVTSHLAENGESDTETLTEADVQIKTRTMASVYEKQGMLQDALDVLISLRGEEHDIQLEADIERVQLLLTKKGKGVDSNIKGRKVVALKNWLEKIHAVS